VNTREYIESGILEAYVLGALSQDERLQVAANVALYPELQQELWAIEATMIRFAESLAVTPPPALQYKIWASVAVASSNAGSGNGELKQPKLMPLRPEQRTTVQWKYAALWVGLIASLLGNVLFWNQAKQSQEGQLALSTQMEQLQNEQKQLAGVVEDYRKSRDMMADTGMQTIVMHTMVPGHPMAATIYWSKSSGEAYVAMNALPEPPKGMQYQLWVIQGGKPVSMGVLAGSMANKAAMQKIAMQVTSSEAFAISLEKEGGNPTPTTVYVLGKA
jgi:anti-sigma-K factor RskA